MDELTGLGAMLVLLASPMASSPNRLAPAEILRTFADAQRTVDDAGSCLTGEGVSAQRFEDVNQRLFELRRKVGGLWGRQALIDSQYERPVRCKRSAAMLKIAQKRLDALDHAFALHSAPFNSGAWVGTMPLCGTEPVETRKAVDEFSGQEVLQITLGKAAAADFAALTTDNVGHPLAVRVDGDIIMEPNINEPIMGGSMQVTGSSAADIDRLAELLAHCAR